MGGFAVGYYGYPRATADIDFWVAISEENAEKLVNVLTEFGFGVENLSVDLFLKENQIVRMGHPPIRVELLTTISGVEFEECYADRKLVDIDGVEVSIISLEDLKRNKTASGRHKDLDDLDHL